MVVLVSSLVIAVLVLEIMRVISMVKYIPTRDVHHPLVDKKGKQVIRVRREVKMRNVRGVWTRVPIRKFEYWHSWLTISNTHDYELMVLATGLNIPNLEFRPHRSCEKRTIGGSCQTTFGIGYSGMCLDFTR
jgi:hypothetical protein